MEKGDKVVCIDDSQGVFDQIVGLRKGQEYIVQDARDCPGCGEPELMCGPFIFSSNNNCDWWCDLCGNYEKTDKPFYPFVDASRFRKVEETKEVKVEYVKKEVEIDIEVEQPILN